MLDLLMVALLQAAAGPPAPANPDTTEATLAQAEQPAPAGAETTALEGVQVPSPVGRAEVAAQPRCRAVRITGSRVGLRAACMSETDHQVHRDLAQRFINTTRQRPGG